MVDYGNGEKRIRRAGRKQLLCSGPLGKPLNLNYEAESAQTAYDQSPNTMDRTITLTQKNEASSV